MRRVDANMSRRIADAMEQPPRPSDCFHNAFVAIKPALDEEETIYYVEGYAGGVDGRRVPHGWLETEEGIVIDVSPGWLDAAETLMRREWRTTDNVVFRKYYPLRRFTLNEVLDTMDKKGPTLPLTDYPEFS